ncbi:ATP-binding cassette domain-containing protein [Oceanospirillum sediminis]|uniref:ATP-binding cassette domain-containing protein n=1 Tax=Oceanospirillum sediminis TaxID=2760088 RepID=A0A839IN00_9GAMM|nr:ATP-binding cassette domain-containing protein [Oceanospirillum sediminis]MBB1486823.1 ATP-binding cassette domain-containing protein [Oceanospirillum sediminis]
MTTDPFSADYPALISIRNLSHNYGKLQALKTLDYDIFTGQFNALLGANGAGKSTLFNLLAGLLRPQQGQFDYLNQPMTSPGADYLANLGIVFQQSTLDPDLTVGQNLHYHASLHGFSRKQARSRIEEELERLNLQDRIKDTVRSLNGGHKRRVEIARALLHQPGFLMLDEATVGLDLSTRKQLTQYLHQRCKQEGLTVLWTTHLIEEIEASDPVMVLHKGTARFSGISHQVIQDAGVADLTDLIEQLTASHAPETITGSETANNSGKTNQSI